MKKLVLQSQAETQSWVKQILPQLTRPCVVRLEGELGAGKTQMVRWFLELLGAQDVASPTFAIHHEYKTPSGPIDHVDLYRVTSDADLEASGFWDLLAQPSGLVFVEWSSRLPDNVWPEHWTQLIVQLSKIQGGDDGRELQFEIKKPLTKIR